MEQILHLHGADGGADLQSRLLGNTKGIPYGLDAIPIQLHGNCHNTSLHRHGDGLDAQGIDLGTCDAFQFDDGNTQLIQKLTQLNFLFERQTDLARPLLHGHIADSNVLHMLTPYR